MTLQTRYVTLDEFTEYFPEVDLVAEIGEASANALLIRTENRLSAFINAKFYRNIDIEYPNFTDYQKQHYKYALLEQIFYTYKNGDNSVDSGYDPEKGVVISSKEMQQKLISPNAIDELILCGVWCRKIGVRNDIWSRWL